VVVDYYKLLRELVLPVGFDLTEELAVVVVGWVAAVLVDFEGQDDLVRLQVGIVDDGIQQLPRDYALKEAWGRDN